MGQIENEEQSGIDQLPEEIYKQTLKNIIDTYLSSTFEKCKVVINAGSAKGDNYIGVLYRVNIEDANGKELNVIIKLPPPNVARREQFHARPCFVRESVFYDSVYPMFKKFQEDKGIDVEKDGFYEVPSCYKTLTEEPFEGLFLEDLKVTGFEMFDRLKEVTVDHVNRVMESLGKLHALSFAIKDQKPELIAPFREIKDIFFQGDELSKESVKNWFNLLKQKALDSLSNVTDEKLKHKALMIEEDDFYNNIEYCVDGSVEAEPYAVICHGDCWNNNIMYRYEVINLKVFIKNIINNSFYS